MPEYLRTLILSMYKRCGVNVEVWCMCVTSLGKLPSNFSIPVIPGKLSELTTEDQLSIIKAPSMYY